MVVGSTGNKFMRMVDQQGLGKKGDISWLVKEMHAELKSWGHPGARETSSYSRATASVPSWR